MEKIKIKIENQFGEVYFETTQQKIDEFNGDDWMEFEELCEEDDFTIDVRTLATDAYRFFEEEGKFILIQEWYFDGYDGGCFSFAFDNCNCPPELEKLLKEKFDVFFGLYQEKYGGDIKYLPQPRSDEEIAKQEKIVDELESSYPLYDIYVGWDVEMDTFKEILEDHSLIIEREGVIRYEEWKSFFKENF